MMSDYVSQLPPGWTTRQTRYLWALVDPDGVDRSFGLTEEAVARAVWTKEEFGGTVLSRRNPGNYKL